MSVLYLTNGGSIPEAEVNPKTEKRKKTVINLLFKFILQVYFSTKTVFNHFILKTKYQMVFSQM